MLNKSDAIKANWPVGRYTDCTLALFEMWLQLSTRVGVGVAYWKSYFGARQGLMSKIYWSFVKFSANFSILDFWGFIWEILGI